MASSGTNPASGRIFISDTFMEAHKDNKSMEIDVLQQTPSQAFVYNNNPRSEMAAVARNASRGLTINHTDSDENAFYAWMNCTYPNDPQAGRERFACGVTHPAQIAKIYPYKSTARGIIIKI